jgi:hypothetical protein
MQTEKLKKATKPYAIKQDSIKRVCNALVEISYFNEQETVESKWIRSICNENKVPMLFNAMLTLGYLKKIKHSIYQVMYTREIVNERVAIKMYKQYNKIKRCVRKIHNNKITVEQITLPPIPELKEVSMFDFFTEQAKETESNNSPFALIREEDVLSAPMYKSVEELMQNPPNGSGRYVIVAVGRSLEVKTQIILD